MKISPKHQHRVTMAILLLGVAAIIITLILKALNENIELYMTPQEVAQGKATLGKPMRMGGFVVPGSIKRDEHSTAVSFIITDGVFDTTVFYEGALPNLFREGQGTIVMGKLKDKQHFEATQVLAKHDETYMPKELSNQWVEFAE